MIGNIVNKICDRFDHPSNCEIPTWVVSTIEGIVYSLGFVLLLNWYCLLFAGYITFLRFLEIPMVAAFLKWLGIL